MRRHSIPEIRLPLSKVVRILDLVAGMYDEVRTTMRGMATKVGQHRLEDAMEGVHVELIIGQNGDIQGLWISSGPLEGMASQ